MKLPASTDYRDAIQNPQLVFNDSDLRRARVETDPLGMPAVSSGGFALTYCLSQSGVKWAVRCFHKYAPDRQRRYAAISDYLAKQPSQIFTQVEYISDGILVNGGRYPIVKMPWLAGETLHKFVDRNINTNHHILSRLPDQFVNLVNRLETLGIAHGDLQHGNIMVTKGQLKLIDYDGMYIPALRRLNSPESGHVNYQHPDRNHEFGPELDRFSAIVIYLGLKAIVAKPSLWAEFSNGENLLFRQDDFRSPNNSKLISELTVVPSTQQLTQRFKIVCQSQLDQVPRLPDFLSGNMSMTISSPREAKSVSYRSQYAVVDANERQNLLKLVGERVTVVGRIVDFRRALTKHGKPYVLLNFGDWRRGCFTIVIWSEVLELFTAQRKDPLKLQNEWVSVTGLLSRYSSTNRKEDQPQIIIETPSEIELLTGGKEEATQRLTNQNSLFPSSNLFSSRSTSKTCPFPQTGSMIKNSASKSKSPAFEAIPAQQKRTNAPDISDLYKDWQAEPKPTPVNSSKSGKISYSSAASQSKAQLMASPNPLRLVESEPGKEWRGQFKVSHSATSSVKIEALALVPGLSVVPHQFMCGSGQAKTVTVSITKIDTICQIPDVFDAVKLTAKNIRHEIQIKARIFKPCLEVSDTKVKFGAIRTREKRERVLKVSNTGTGSLFVNVKQKLPWLLVKPDQFTCAPGETKEMTIITDGSQLKSAHTANPFELPIWSNAGTRVIRVFAELAEPRLEANETALNFDKVQSGELHKTQFNIRNSGTGPLYVRIEPIGDWLKVFPCEFACSTGDSQKINVFVSTNIPAGELMKKVGASALKWPSSIKTSRPKNEFSIPNALKIDSNGGSAVISAKLQILRPEILIDNQIQIPLAYSGDGQASIIVGNSGTGILKGEFDGFVGFSGEKIMVSPKKFSCSTGERISIVVKLCLKRLNPEKFLPKGKITLRSNAGDREINLETKLEGPWPIASSKEIDFGSYESGKSPTKELVITNIGNQVLNGKIVLEKEDKQWLSVDNHTFSIQSSDSTTISFTVINSGPVKLLSPAIRKRNFSTKIRILSNVTEIEIPVKLISKYHGSKKGSLNRKSRTK